MRDRLIELLSNAPADFDGNRNVCTLAEHLLENGVIVPPCKVGDVVYVIFNMFKKKIETCRVDEFLIGENGMFAVLDVHYPNYHASRRATIPVSWFGCLAFTARDLVEQALKDGAE